MKIIKMAKEINYHYFGLNKGNLPNGHFLAILTDIFVNPRHDETTKIWLIYKIYLQDRVELKSQMFYMSGNPESMFDRFFYNFGMNKNAHSGYAFNEMIGQTGIVTIENDAKGAAFSNIVNFIPMDKEEWVKELSLFYREQAGNNDETN
ncbi:hypothetical protein [Acetobacterium wieringae]|uniref:hypothetical protein n=1 Tax=Acetobacterium wieringae TaxID=52694 RepID=UPI002033F49B|nr:hypothetical protein [Acetobacterium wieringae]URN83905.1 hypothetical protein CHL1_003066 [Acetobacterium wieringae]